MFSPKNFLGAILGAVLASLIGRKGQFLLRIRAWQYIWSVIFICFFAGAIMLSIMPSITGWCVLAISQNVIMLYAGRSTKIECVFDWHVSIISFQDSYWNWNGDGRDSSSNLCLWTRFSKLQRYLNLLSKKELKNFEIINMTFRTTCFQWSYCHHCWSSLIICSWNIYIMEAVCMDLP